MKSTGLIASLDEGVVFVNEQVSAFGRELAEHDLYIEFTWEDAVRVADAPWPQPRCCRFVMLRFVADVGPDTAARLMKMAFE